ncbi:nitrate- and nitrite sensing domain-containing protein [Streptomyces sp. ZYX-F-203]
MQKTRPRRTGKQKAPAGDVGPTPGTTDATGPGGPSGRSETPVGKGRPTRVRNRLLVAVAVVAATVAAAGAPSVVATSGRLHDSQELVVLAGRTQDALTLAHALADERDQVTPYVSAGRPESMTPSEQHSDRVDRQVEEFRRDAGVPSSLRSDLDGIAAVRRAALTGESTALEAHRAYSETVAGLHALADRLAEEMTPRAGGGAHALAELDTAVQQAAATRGLLLAALSVPTATETVLDPVTGLPVEITTSSEEDGELRDALTAAAQRARVRSDAALEGFLDGATGEARDGYTATVAGPEIDEAEERLATLTDAPTLADDELDTATRELEGALTARLDAMRGAESALFERRTAALEELRDDDVTALELHAAALGVLVLVAVGVTAAMARTLTRPLAVLRRGSARLAEAENPVAEEPVSFTGRDDEFARTIRSVNASHARTVALAERIGTLESDRKHLVAQRQRMADAREELRDELDAATARLQALRKSIGGTFVNLSLRTLGLVERQLTVIEGLEEREQDPERLATLFKLDHFATVMRRHSENLLVLAGSEHVQHSAAPVPLVDVVRAAVSEIERYERVRIAALPPRAHVVGFAADDLSHLLAELMENATSFSPPDLPVEVSGWLLESGEVMLSVQDGGIGVDAERLERLNARLAEVDPDAPFEREGEQGLGLGLYVVARLAHRHGARVRLRREKQGGATAVVVLPTSLLAPEPAVAEVSPPAASEDEGTVVLSGSEPGTSVLPGRGDDADPVVEAAERALRRAEEAERTGGTTGDSATARLAPADPSERTGEGDVGEAPAAPRSTAGPAPERRPDGDGDGEPAGPAEDRTSDDDLGPEAVQETGGAPEPEEERETAAASPAAASDPAEADHPAWAPDAVGPADPGEVRTRPVESAPTAAAPSPGEGLSETTMELLVPNPASETAPPAAEVVSPRNPRSPAGGRPRPDEPSRPADPEPEPAHDRAPDRESDPGDGRITGKGLPKRTPKVRAPAPTTRARTASVDAEELRRRLGGFHRGAEAGRRDVAEEIAATGTREGTTEEATGGTVEEERR